MSDNIRRVYLRDKDGNILSPITGGGSSEGAISYEPQTLTEAQQMQARKNQGLYNKKAIPGFTITWDGDTTGKESIDFGEGYAFYKMADSPTQIVVDSVQSVGITWVEGDDTGTELYEFQYLGFQDVSSAFQGGKAFSIIADDGPWVLVCDKVVYEDVEYNGIYFCRYADDTFVSYTASFACNDCDVIDRIPIEYIPDLTIYIDYPVGGSPVISRGEDILGQFVEALKGGAGSPKIVVMHGTNEAFFTYTEFGMGYHFGSEGNPDRFTINSKSFDGDGNADTTSVTISGKYKDGVCSEVRVSIGNFNE